VTKTQHQYDYAMVGHNYISYMMSIPLIKKGKKIIVLDDDHFNYGDMFTNSMLYLDAKFLSEYGALEDIPILSKVLEYTDIKGHYFYLGRKSFFLGLNPFDSYRELTRKWPQFFLETSISSEEFNQYYFESCNTLAFNFLFNKKSKSSYLDIFLKSVHPELIKLFEGFFSKFEQKKNFSIELRHEFHAFVFLMRSFLQNRMAISGTKSEIFHLFMAMLSPFYVLKHEKLVHELKNIHQSFGGTYRDLKMVNLKLDSNKLSGIELFNFEGLLNPNNVVFFGGNPKIENLRLKNAEKTAYQMIKGKIQLSKIPDYIKNVKLIFTSPIKIGTDHPLFEVTFETQSLVFNILSYRRNGDKLDFIKDELLQSLHADLNYLYPEIDFEFIHSELDFTQDIFLEDKNFLAHLKKDNKSLTGFSHFFMQNSPVVFKKLKNVFYFGPFNNESLGLFSSLVELKKWQTKIA